MTIIKDIASLTFIPRNLKKTKMHNMANNPMR